MKGIPFKTRERTFANRSDVKLWIIKNQIGRRNLTPSQKAMLYGLELEKLEAEKAKERMSEYGKIGRESETKKDENQGGGKFATPLISEKEREVKG